MNEMEVQLINVGRNKVCKTVNVKNENGIFKALKPYLLSKEIELVQSGCSEDRYVVVVGGMRVVGEVMIVKQ